MGITGCVCCGAVSEGVMDGWGLICPELTVSVTVSGRSISGEFWRRAVSEKQNNIFNFTKTYAEHRLSKIVILSLKESLLFD